MENNKRFKGIFPRIGLILFVALLIVSVAYFAVASIFGNSFVGGIFGNKQLIDTNIRYDRAIIQLPDGSIISGDVQSWNDYDNSDQIQVKINGVTYLVHSSNVVLIDE